MKHIVKKQSLALVLLGTLLMTAIPQASNAMSRDAYKPVSKFNLSDQEKKRIDAWLAQKKLNAYGDPEGTMYAGGTPLFDERTGWRRDRYEYIMSKFPKSPWKLLAKISTPLPQEQNII